MRFLSACLLYLFLFFQTIDLQAQVFSFGIKGGLNYTNISGDYSFENEFKTGLNFGAFANFNFTRMMGVVSEINYEQKGFRYKSYSNQTEQIIGEKRFDYLTIPILFKYQFGKNTKFFVTIGTYLGILVYAYDKGQITDESVLPPLVSSWNHDIYFDTQDVDMGLSFGVGLQIPLNRRFGLVLEGRYQPGLMLVEPDKMFIEEYRNVSMELNLGIIYHLAY